MAVRNLVLLSLLLSCPAVAVAAADGPTTDGGSSEGQSSPAREPAAVTVLRRANSATEAVKQVAYEYEYLGLGMWPGRLAGSVRMRQVTDQSDSWIRTAGVILAPPAGYERAARSYETSIDGGTAYFIDRHRRTFSSAPYGRGGNHLSRNQVYEALYQFVNPSPFAFELERSSGLVSLGVGNIEGVECDIVKVIFPPGLGIDEAVWYFGRKDALPRAVMMTAAQDHRPGFFTFRVRNLRTDVALAARDFVLSRPEGFESRGAGAPAAGAMTPDWTLRTPSGETVSPASLRGKVAVLDFWVTHCPFCRTTMPEIQKLHEAYRDRPVRFLGVNVWESGDPIEHMRKNGFDYDILLHGEALADLYGFQWQPALVILGPDGTILHTSGGASADRTATIRDAIDEALAGMSGR